jgi:dihydrofolate reductase
VHRYEPCTFEGLEVLGRLRLAEPELGGDLADGPWREAQELDDSQAVALCEGREKGVFHGQIMHRIYILEKECFSNGRRYSMGKVLAEMSMSVDGYVAGRDDGAEALHRWYSDGDVETPTGTEGFSFRTSAASAEVLRKALVSTGALITGRRNFDIAGGWGGEHPVGVPVFVVTHSTPDGWPREDAPFTFLDSVEQAVAEARVAAGEKSVVIASPGIAQQALALGLLDEVAISLVPILLGDGIPFFAKRTAEPIALSGPTVVTGSGVTHLTFEVVRTSATTSASTERTA